MGNSFSFLIGVIISAIKLEITSFVSFHRNTKSHEHTITHTDNITGQEDLGADFQSSFHMTCYDFNRRSERHGQKGGNEQRRYLENYDIFISHSGAQKNFAEQLHRDVRRENMSCFFDKDPKSLPKGEEFPSRIFQAAQKCKVAVIVLSKEFLSSKWPMMELMTFVEALMSSNPTLKIFPLFFKMSTETLSEKIRNGGFLQDWKNIEESDQTFKDWIRALKTMRKFNGLKYYEDEGEVVYRDKIVDHIRSLLPTKLKYDDSLVEGKTRICNGLAKRLANAPFRENCVKVLGVYGTNGSGKSTVCMSLCNFYSRDFSGRVFHAELQGNKSIKTLKHVLQFLTDASETLLNSVTCKQQGWNLLRERMPSHKVVLALDGITEQLESIEEARRYLSAGFGEGSLIILTARSRDTLQRVILESECSFVHVPDLTEQEATAVLLKMTPLKISNLTRKQNDAARECVNNLWFKWYGEDVIRKEQKYHPLGLQNFGAHLFHKLQCDMLDWNKIVELGYGAPRSVPRQALYLADLLPIFMLFTLHWSKTKNTDSKSSKKVVKQLCDLNVEFYMGSVVSIKSISHMKRNGFIGTLGSESTDQSKTNQIGRWLPIWREADKFYLLRVMKSESCRIPILSMELQYKVQVPQLVQTEMLWPCAGITDQCPGLDAQTASPTLDSCVSSNVDDASTCLISGFCVGLKNIQLWQLVKPNDFPSSTGLSSNFKNLTNCCYLEEGATFECPNLRWFSHISSLNNFCILSDSTIVYVTTNGSGCTHLQQFEQSQNENIEGIHWMTDSFEEDDVNIRYDEVEVDNYEGSDPTQQFISDQGRYSYDESDGLLFDPDHEGLTGRHYNLEFGNTYHLVKAATEEPLTPNYHLVCRSAQGNVDCNRRSERHGQKSGNEHRRYLATHDGFISHLNEHLRRLVRKSISGSFISLIFQAAQKSEVGVFVFSEEFIRPKWPKMEITIFVEDFKSSNPCRWHQMSVKSILKRERRNLSKFCEGLCSYPVNSSAQHGKCICSSVLVQRMMATASIFLYSWQWQQHPTYNQEQSFSSALSLLTHSWNGGQSVLVPHWQLCATHDPNYRRGRFFVYPG